MIDLMTLAHESADVASQADGGHGINPAVTQLLIWLIPVVFLIVFLVLLLRSGKFKKQFEVVDQSARHMESAEQHMQSAEGHMQRMEQRAEEMTGELKKIRQLLQEQAGKPSDS